MLGIRIPAPVPSSDIMMLVMFSFLLSITKATCAPSLAIFLTLDTKLQVPRSTRYTGKFGYEPEV